MSDDGTTISVNCPRCSVDLVVGLGPVAFAIAPFVKARGDCPICSELTDDKIEELWNTINDSMIKQPEGVVECPKCGVGHPCATPDVESSMLFLMLIEECCPACGQTCEPDHCEGSCCSHTLEDEKEDEEDPAIQEKLRELFDDETDSID